MTRPAEYSVKVINLDSVGLSASMAALRLLQRATAIRCEARLALNADRPTESKFITLTEY